MTCPWPLRRHQAEALAAFEASRQAGARRFWITMPPGAGKTLVGTEVVRALGRPAVVFSPNTAIQGQWTRTWDSYDAGSAGTDRSLQSPFTSLTYQSLAVFEREDGDDEGGDDEGGDDDARADPRTGRELERLHPNGRALIESLRDLGPVTLVLDECHHLLEVWGRLLAEVLAELPAAMVLGLTATPPDAMTRSQVELTDTLFGPILYEARIPALVKERTLAPYAELALLVTPTAEEAQWLADQSIRFRELTSDLFAPDFGSTTLPVWLHQRFVAPPEAGDQTWDELAAREPELTDSALRMVHAGLLPRPLGSVLRERHQQDPGSDDWVRLLEDWLLRCVVPRAEVDPRDRTVLETVRRTLPAIGYVWSRRGIRAGTGTVDRVTARSSAKQRAAGTILAAERAALGDQARALVLCDHERATATLERRLVDGDRPPPQAAGSALGVLAELLGDPGTAPLEPVLVTGTTVAASPETLERLRDFVATRDPGLASTLVVTHEQVARLCGPWRSSQWVAHVTDFFSSGGCRALVGTRGLLGEGWDAPAVTALVDLTTVTTATAVVQTRGRALRIDPARPEKVALIWTPVCVFEGHVTGANDWHRFVRKHVGYFTADEHGTVTDGVAGVDSEFSPFHPPPATRFDEIGARMLVRAEDRDAVRDTWLAGGYRDTVRHVVRVRSDPTARTLAPLSGPAMDPALDPALGTRALTPYAERVSGHPGGWTAALAVVLAAAGGLLLSPAWLALLLVLAFPLALALWGRSRVLAASRQRLSLGLVAAAVADGLRNAGRSAAGAEAVRIEVAPGGETRVSLEADEQSSATFALALEEVTSPMSDPRYVISRRVTSAPRGPDLLRGLASARQLRPDAEAWHTVPSAVARSRADADAFARAWQHWVGGGPAVYAHGAEGSGVIAATRGADPFSVTSVIRREWS